MRRSLISIPLAGLMLLIWPATAFAAVDPGLGTAGNYAVLAGTTITASGSPSWITGRMGVSPGSSVTGFPPSTSGPQDVANAVALQAKLDLTTAFNNLSTPPQPAPVTQGPDLAGLTLGPGVYSVAAAATNLSGTLTLSGSGVYVFQLPSTLITSSGSVVSLINGALPCQVFWQVNSSATIGSTTKMVGNILALTDIGMLAGATLNGRALARNGQVTLINNRIIQAAGCGYSPPAYVAGPAGTTLPATLAPSSPIGAPPPTPVGASTGIPSDPSGGFPWLLVMAIGAGFGAAALVVGNRRRRRTS